MAFVGCVGCRYPVDCAAQGCANEATGIVVRQRDALPAGRAETPRVTRHPMDELEGRCGMPDAAALAWVIAGCLLVAALLVVAIVRFA
jgi:hypothetical protein